MYLVSGTSVIFLVDPHKHTVTIRDANGSRVFDEEAVIGHRSLPGFRLAARDLFELVKPK